LLKEYEIRFQNRISSQDENFYRFFLLSQSLKVR